MNCKIEVDVLVNYEKWFDEFPDIENLVNDNSNKILKLTDIVNNSKYLELSVVLCDDNFIQDLNRNYRNSDKPTNVLSFEADSLIAGNYKNCQSDLILGDVIISLDTIKKEAIDQNKILKNHLIHMLTHGILHLMGYDHIDDKDAIQMEGLEVEILRNFSISSPY